MQTPTVKAILVSDLHLSSNPPIARAKEDWYEVMDRYLSQLRELKRKYKAPIVCAGDVFDRWNCDPRLINFALQSLPGMYAIPGQHDIPYHKLSEMHRSAYETLSLTGKLINVDALNGFVGFPWGVESQGEARGRVGVIHGYCYTNKTGHPKAESKYHAKQWTKRFSRFRVLHFGDNHRAFKVKVGRTLIYNPGTFIRRTIADAEHKPQAGLLMSDWTIRVHYLDTSGDRLSSDHKKEATESTLELPSVGNVQPYQWESKLESKLKSLPEPVRTIVREALGSNA